MGLCQTRLRRCNLPVQEEETANTTKDGEVGEGHLRLREGGVVFGLWSDVYMAFLSS